MGQKSNGIDTSAPHPARRYNYWLGGKDHFAADRASGDAIAGAFPGVVELARANRAFLRRAVRFLAESGVRQFLDVGAGLPAPANTHEVAQAVDPACRVVYVDNDPIVMAHARALLTGGTDCAEADLRDPAEILGSRAVRDSLDLGRPVGLLLVAVLHFVHDDARADRAVERLVDALAPGSFLVLSHATLDFGTREGAAAYQRMFSEGGTDVRTRPKSALDRWLDGLEIVEPGIVPVGDWRPRETGRPGGGELGVYAAVGRKH